MDGLIAERTITNPNEPPPMPSDEPTVTFERLTDINATSPTLIEGLPGHGLVAAIAADMITRQLDLDHHGNIISDDFPAVTTYVDGRVRDIVRVYAGDDPAIMTLQSDMALPAYAFPALSECILQDLAGEFDRAIFLAGAPAVSEERIGDVVGIATNDRIGAELTDAGIELAEGHGLVGGITGALTNACYQANIPAAVLIVQADPFLPDPIAARSVIENALEPFVNFDIDTSELLEQGDRIRDHMEQVARHYQQIAEQQTIDVDDRGVPTMYQ